MSDAHPPVTDTSATKALDMSDLPPFLTVEEAAELYREPETTIQRWCRDGKLVGAVKPVRHWRIPRATVLNDLTPGEAG